MANERFTTPPPPNVPLTEGSDYWLQNRPLQPKREIGDYVEGAGILVPTRFGSLQEALSSGRPFIIRSEHPQDYDGASGLVDSFSIDEKTKAAGRVVIERQGSTIDWEGFRKRYDHHVLFQIIGLTASLPQDQLEEAMREYSWGPIGRYCQLMGMPDDSFTKDVSFSYWEHLSGENRTITADSAIKDRHHIITRKGATKNYIVFENGNVVLNSHSGEYDPEDIGELVDLYEQVRTLPRFNPSHCPSVEVQSNGGGHYFLQYHRTQDFSPAMFELDRKAESDELETVHVRGATSPDGIVVNTTIYDAAGSVPVIKPEGGYFNEHWDQTYDEIMARLRRVQFLTEERFLSRLRQFAGHTLNSKFFKPELAVVLDHAQAYEKIFSTLPKPDEVDRSQGAYAIPLRVISDGRRALVRRV